MPIERIRSSVIAITASLVVLTLATMDMIGWWPQQAVLESLPRDGGSSPGMAVCFWLAGVSLLLPRARPSWRCRAQITAGCLIVIISSLILFATLLSVISDAGQPLLHHWFSVQNSTLVGRMAPDASIGFIASGLVLILMHFARVKWVGVATQILTFLVLGIGMTDALIHALNLDLVYGLYRHARMTSYTAAGFIVLSIALVATWTHMPWARPLYQGYEDEKVSLVGGAILMVIAIATGVGTFAILQRKTETALTHELALTLQSRADFFAQTINQGESDARFIATRPTLLRQLAKLESDPDAPVALAALQDGVRSFVDLGRIAVAIYDRHGHMIVHAGEFIRRPEADVRLALPHSVQLL